MEHLLVRPVLILCSRLQNCHSLQMTCTILYMAFLKDSIIKLLHLSNEFSKIAGYKINICESVAFLYPNNEVTGWINKKKYGWPLQQNTKILRYELNQGGRYQYPENYRCLQKEMQTNGSIYHVHRQEGLTSLNCPYDPKKSLGPKQSLLK